MASDSPKSAKPLASPDSAPIEPLERQLGEAEGSAEGCYLLMVQGPTPGKLTRVTGEETTIGRSEGAGLRLDTQSVSHRHAKLILKGPDCWIVDLGSTNGTFINQERVVGTAALRVGDALRLGNVTFAFLRESDEAKAHTMSLHHDRSVTLTRTSSLLGLPPSAAAPVASPMGTPAANIDDEGPSLKDYIRWVRLGFAYLRRYAWLLVTCLAVGMAGGIVYSRLKPPPATASFEISLLAEAQANPMEKQSGRPQAVIFVAAKNAFRSTRLIKETMGRLEFDNISEKAAGGLQGDLTFDPLDRWGKVWRGEFQAANAELAEQFLKTHLDVYLESEIEKTLQVIQTRDEFLEKQLTEAKVELTTLENSIAEFRERHPQIIPIVEDINVPVIPDTAGNAKASASTQLRAVRDEMAQLRRRMDSGDTLLADRVKDAQKYRSQIAAAEAKLAQARADGLTERHPKVERLRSQVAELKQLEQRTIAAESTELQKRTNQEYRQMRERLEQLKRSEAGLAKQIQGADEQIAKKRKEELSLPELETRYREMAREHASVSEHYQTLSSKKKSHELQLEIERAAASSRYDIITPPTAAPPNMTSAMIKRLLFGAAIGIFIAFAIAAFVELRALFQRPEFQTDV